MRVDKSNKNNNKPFGATSKECFMKVVISKMICRSLSKNCVHCKYEYVSYCV